MRPASFYASAGSTMAYAYRGERGEYQVPLGEYHRAPRAFIHTCGEHYGIRIQRRERWSEYHVFSIIQKVPIIIECLHVNPCLTGPPKDRMHACADAPRTFIRACGEHYGICLQRRERWTEYNVFSIIPKVETNENALAERGKYKNNYFLST
jgi:hypothetical protein